MKMYACDQCGTTYVLRTVHDGRCHASYVNAIGGVETCGGLLLPLTTAVGIDKQFVPPEGRQT